MKNETQLKYIEKLFDEKLETISVKLRSYTERTDLKFSEIEKKIDILLDKLEGGQGVMSRVENLEGFRQYLLGTVFVLSAIVGIFINVFIDWFKKSLGIK